MPLNPTSSVHVFGLWEEAVARGAQREPTQTEGARTYSTQTRPYPELNPGPSCRKAEMLSRPVVSDHYLLKHSLPVAEK